jgi:hypothetical protein
VLKLENIAYGAMILASVAAVAFMYDARRARADHDADSKQTKQVTAATSLVGTKIAVPGGDWGKSGTNNVVLAISEKCPYCVASLPFYRKLAAEEHAGRLKLLLTVVVAGPAAETRAWLAREGVAPDQVLDMPLVTIGVHRTPTLLVVDNEGTVTKSYSGKLDGSREVEVLQYLASSPRSMPR